MEIVTFQGWNRNARLVCNDQEMIVTLEVGPRILGYGFIGGANEMHVNPKTAGTTGGTAFKTYGGHRLWISPEEDPKTFTPDNDPVTYSQDGEWHVFTTDPDTYHVVREIRIKTDEPNDRFVLDHRLYNHSGYALTFSPWAPTQFTTGGQCLIPQAPYIPHSEKVLPARPLTLWNYTDMSDERWTWGKKLIRLRWDDKPPTKAGSLVTQGYVAHINHGNVHLRRFGYDPAATYPDFGINFETFTRQDMLEVEPLGPLQTVQPGNFASHVESWYLIKGETVPDDLDAAADWLEHLAASRPL